MIYYILGYIVGKYNPFAKIIDKFMSMFKKKEEDKNV